MKAQVLTLADLPIDRPMPRIERQRVIAERMMISKVRLLPGFVLETHQHDNEQIVVMVKGRCRFTLGAVGSPDFREVDVKGGQVLVLPGGTPHSCVVIEETEILDLFSPISEKTGVDR
ncbi:MAG: cupin domain-containing protein [Planctomycetota bacterium]